MAMRERRRDLRVAWSSRVRCLPTDGSADPVDGVTCNVSAGGALVAKEGPVAVGEPVVFEFVSDDPPLAFRRMARVVRDDGQSADGRHLAALRFEGGSRDVRARLTAGLITVAARSGERAPSA